MVSKLYCHSFKAGNDDLFNKISLLRSVQPVKCIIKRSLEYLCALSISSNFTYVELMRSNFDVILDAALYIEDEREQSGSSSVAGYISDCRRVCYLMILCD